MKRCCQAAVTGNNRLKDQEQSSHCILPRLAVRKRARSSLLSNAGAVSSGEDWETKLRYVSCGRHTIALTSMKARRISKISPGPACQQFSLPPFPGTMAIARLKGLGSEPPYIKPVSLLLTPSDQLRRRWDVASDP